MGLRIWGWDLHLEWKPRLGLGWRIGREAPQVQKDGEERGDERSFPNIITSSQITKTFLQLHLLAYYPRPATFQPRNTTTPNSTTPTAAFTMGLIGRIISQRLGPLMGDTHQEQQNVRHHQDPYYHDPYHNDAHQNFHHNPPHHCHQPQVIYGGYHYATPQLSSKRQHRTERRIERHYRRAERSMQRADHKVDRDLRRAERRGHIVSMPVPVGPSMQGAPASGQRFSGEPNGYEMRDMRSQQRQEVFTPELESPHVYAPELDSREAGPASRDPRHHFEGAPPPAYEEVVNKS